MAEGVLRARIVYKPVDSAVAIRKLAWSCVVRRINLRIPTEYSSRGTVEPSDLTLPLFGMLVP